MSKIIQQKIDVDSALAEDKAFHEGVTEYDRISEQAMTVAEELASTLIESIVKSADNKDPQRFTLSAAILATAKALTILTSYAYTEENLYLADIQRAREIIPSVIIPALLNPRPCGLCDNCKNGKPEQCINPVMDKENTQSSFLPLVSGFLIEYDLWTKILYMHTAGKVPTSVDKPVDNVDNQEEAIKKTEEE